MNMLQNVPKTSIFISLIGIIFISGGCTKVEGDREQRSYSVGFTLGQQLTPVKEDIDPDFVARGLKDGIANTPKLETEVLASRLNELQLKQRERSALSAADTLKASLEYIDSVAKRPGIKILEAGILIEETKAGSGPTRNLKDEDEVIIKYVAKRTDGSVFDQTADANGIKLRIKDLVLPGLKKVVRTMPPEAEWTVHLAPDQAYGTGTRPGIPSQSALIYDITVLRPTKKK